MLRRPLPLLLSLLFLSATAFAQSPQPQLLKRVPPPGIAITSADRAELSAGVEALGKEIASLAKDLAGKPELLALLPDVQIFHKAVDWALRYDEFFSTGEVAKAKQQLEMGTARAAELRAGQASWNAISGADGKPTADGKDKLPALVVRGYKSKIDGSIQPYGVVLPEDYKPGDNKERPLHFWCHGRGEKLTELDFVNQRMTSKGEYTPPGAFVIHLYGRYCCANKFAGEVDLFEAMENAAQRYPIDPARLVVRGFSMGGASAWQFATHFAGLWAAANPGAGFGESKEFLKLGLTPDKPMPPEWEQKLWRWYDSTLYVSNLANTTTVAYSGEIDGQKQAADIMIRYARQEAGNAHPPVAELGKVAPGDGSPKAEEARVAGTAPDLALYHVIAPNTPHKVVEPAKTEVEKLVEAAVVKGREAVPKKVHLTTYSLIYPKMEWATISGMEKQWERADVEATLSDGVLSANTKNVMAIRFDLPASSKFRVVIDGQALPEYWSGALTLSHQAGGGWKVSAAAGTTTETAGNKRPNLCGPIDHAFMSSFVFVRPSGKPLNKVVGDWVESELGHAVAQWRAVFRGDARVVADTALSADDIANSNLILWGDPSSNAVLKKLLAAVEGAAPSGPGREATGQGRDGARPSSALASILKWDGKELAFGGKTYDATHVAPILIFPNPLNPQKYVVLNSGFTMREAAALNNAQQTPKLPDWAIVDLNSAPDAYQPGKILRAGFFDEQWQPPAK
ncbi:MAG: hypothetical protein WCF18_23850 [Chthoniobacteraceae bacterium]